MKSQQDSLALMDLGDASEETKQHWVSQQYPDNIFGRGPYPGWLEDSAEGGEDLAPL